jgi:hypothetical protein
VCREHHILVGLLGATKLSYDVENGSLTYILRFGIQPDPRRLPVFGKAIDQTVVLTAEVERRDVLSLCGEHFVHEDAKGAGLVDGGYHFS